MAVSEAGGAEPVPAGRGTCPPLGHQHAALAPMGTYPCQGAVRLSFELWVPQDLQCHIAYPFGRLLLAQEVEDFHQAVRDGEGVVFHCFYRLFEPQKGSTFPSVTYCLLC